MQLCQGRKSCNQGYVEISYQNDVHCLHVETNGKSSEDPEQNNYVKTLLGPHTFFVIFDGPTRLNVEAPEYMGNCRYRYHYNLRNGGDFELRAFLLNDVIYTYFLVL